MIIKFCSKENCDGIVIARGVCRYHYGQWKRYGGESPQRLRMTRDGVCAAIGCNRPIYFSGLCNLHNKRQKAHGDFTTVKTLQKQQGPCGIIGCGKVIERGNYCGIHYSRMYKTGLPTSKLAPRGSWSFDTRGYLVGTVEGKRCYQHIHLAEKALGRELKGTEEIHHMNEIKHDNLTPFNLVICPDRAYHVLLHARSNAIKQREARANFTVEKLNSLF